MPGVGGPAVDSGEADAVVVDMGEGMGSVTTSFGKAISFGIALD